MYDELRLSYKPDRVTVLYVAESPPIGGTFFYNANSNLYEALQSAFFSVFGDKCGVGVDFLDFFKSKCCYLEDICSESVNGMPLHSPGRESARQLGVAPLSLKVAEMRPAVIVVLMKAIETSVNTAVRDSGFKPRYQFATPFPSHGEKNRLNCVKQNTTILRLLLKEHLLT